MAPKAVDARKRFIRSNRFRGHGPLLHIPSRDQLIQPSSRIAQAACHIFVMCLIFPPANSMKYT